MNGPKFVWGLAPLAWGHSCVQLLSAQISGFRRFATAGSVRLAEPLIALVGPNEAGKSSILDALLRFEAEEPIPRRDATRRTNISPTIELLFELDDEDRAALVELDLPHPMRRCTFRKESNGSLHIFLDPSPVYDRQFRPMAAEKLASVPRLLDQRAKQAKDLQKRKAELDKVAKLLSSDQDCLRSDEIARIDNLAAFLKPLAASPRPSKGEDPIAAAVAALNDVKKDEEDSPVFQARSILAARRPQFLYFDDDSRNLESSYDIAAVAKQAPRALSNLARLAGLDLRLLAAALKSGDRAHVQEVINAANRQLEEHFSKAWIEPGVVPTFSDDGTSLFLLVQTPHRAVLSHIDERSDGLRWFIALLAFLHGRSDSPRPILLVEEAERHLSYDAQANLISVLERQRLAQKIIYTTHSAGCLPSDLGTGVRPIIPMPSEGERSRISNCFWTNEPGFSPLLLAMGLGPLAFTPARNVVIGEGPSECILLPSLLREAISLRQLSFQVAPGASHASSSNFREMLAEAGRVAFVLDGDSGGLEIKKLLLAAGASEEQVRTYRDFFGKPVVFEDLVLPDVYAEAFDSELARWQQSSERLPPADLPETGRAKWVDDWCQDRGLDKVTKATLCQRLAEEAASGRRLLSKHTAGKLKKLHAFIERYFAPDVK